MSQSISELLPLYVAAGRLDALADGLRLVQDVNVRNQYSWQINNALPQLLATMRTPDELYGLYSALNGTTSDANGTSGKTPFVEAFANLPKNAETLDLYHRIAFPTPKQEGQAWDFSRALADLAKDVNAIDAVEHQCDKAIADFPRVEAARRVSQSFARRS